MRNLKNLLVVSTAVVMMLSSHGLLAETVYKVKSNDSMGKIVKQFYKDSPLNNQQKYIAILAENPDAFRFGNINYLKKGASLVLPEASKLLAMEAADAVKLVARHNAATQKGKKAILPPPFENYTPASKAKTMDVNKLAQKQEAASEELKRLDEESEQLRIRLEQLEADKEAMDAELKQLNTLIKKE